MIGSFLLGCLICSSSIMLVSMAVDNKNLKESNIELQKQLDEKENKNEVLNE